MKENFIKKFWCIVLAVIMAGIFLTACAGGAGEEAEQESQPKEQEELQNEMRSNVRAKFQTRFQTGPQSEYKPQMNKDNWAQAYLSVIDELREDWDLDGIDFGLIYVNDDDIPELVFGPEGYWASVYTWKDGQVYIVMDKRAYGTWGRNYTYVPFQNIIKEYAYYYFDYNDDGFTRRCYNYFHHIAETTYELEFMYGLIVEDFLQYESDEMEESTLYYVEPDGTEREITEEEYDVYYDAQGEEDISLRGDSPADEIINELVKARQRFSNDEWETETTLSDITWDDYHSGSYETWLHFSFNNGVVIDKELQYSPSMVEYADFVDITGDGADEVLIYRYFANTVTEYTLINFFRIEENSVTEISPGLELEELANDVWNVADADFSEEEYGMPVFTMESYVKENMLGYPDKRVLVGYRGGGWHILEWLDCPEPDVE